MTLVKGALPVPALRTPFKAEASPFAPRSAPPSVRADRDEFVGPASSSAFPALAWLDPLSYESANPKELPYKQASEIKISKDVQAQRTPEGIREALRLGKIGNGSMWYDFAKEYGKKFGPIKGAKGMALLKAVMGINGVNNKILKNKFDAKRPYEADPSISFEGPKPQGSSHPSSHTATAYAAATVMSHLWPERKEEFMNAAAEVARSRVYAGAHFAGDVAAGARYGSEFAKDLIKGFTANPFKLAIKGGANAVDFIDDLF
jgi:hypothetical protein